MKALASLIYWATLLALLVVMAVLAFTTHARAEPRCMGLADALAMLQSRYGEVPMWRGALSDGGSLLITANPAGTDWTAMVQRPAGDLCMLTGGAAWGPPDVSAGAPDKEG